MSEIAIIGTAGRQADKNRMNAELYGHMYFYLQTRLKQASGPVTAISGGAAWSDHLAVHAYLNNDVDHLILHLPAAFISCQFVSNRFQDPGSTSNYYHKLFSEKLGASSLQQIQQAIDKGATTIITNGFKPRNLQVARAKNFLLAFTFGTHSGTYANDNEGWHHSYVAGLKDGGTAHTWNNAVSTYKEHISLNEQF